VKFIYSVVFSIGLIISPYSVAGATEVIYTIKLMTPETALKAALAGLKECRGLGYQVAVAVVDRTGQTQVVLRDRFAGMHTIESATNKAWTAISFKTNTRQFAENTQSGKESSGIRHIQKVLAIGGGMMVEAGGNLYGAIGVSGAPSGEADDKCTQAAITSIIEDLEML
jgi:uncharacterized protein GlcG (DUF336 family)